MRRAATPAPARAINSLPTARTLPAPVDVEIVAEAVAVGFWG